MAKVEIIVPETTIGEKRSQHLFWVRQTGDHVEKGASVASVEAVKGLNFITAPVSGVLCEQTVEKGAAVGPGQLIGYIEE